MTETQQMLAGRYEVGDLIGRGGMAEVHIGYDTRLGRTVAIKILRPDLARDPSFQTRFRREAQAAAGLNHPSIVAVYDTGEEHALLDDGSQQTVPFIVMEYVEGHTVRDILKDGHAAPIDEAIEILSGVLSALEYSHQNGLVHRDIKPANVMLTPTGAVKVMDFGIARALADAGQTMTQTQAVVGTAQYLSPEQARGENVDARSDLYSAGCLLFELLCGRPPFQGDSPVAVAYQHVREPAPLPSSIAPDVPHQLDQIVMRALAKDRGERYTSAGEFLADLQAVMSGGQLGPVTGAIPLGSAATGSGAAGVMSTQGIGATEVMPVSQTQTQTMAYDPDELVEDDGDRWRRWRLIGILVGAVALAVLSVLAVFQIAAPSSGPDGVELVTVPDVRDMTEQAALDTLDSFGLTGEVRREASEDVPVDLVIRSEPALGSQISPDVIVVIVVSTGPTEIEVPPTRGLTEEDAIARIEAEQLTVLRIVVEDGDPLMDEGRVIRTEPAEGEIVGEAAEITIFVSSGKIEMPDVVGEDIEDADEILTEAGFSYLTEEEQTNAFEPGTVIAQDPEPGLVERNTGVMLTIAIPIETVAVPTVAGRPESTAIAAVRSAGLEPEVTYAYSDVYDAGLAISASPASGTVVNEGTTVTIVVSLGPEPDPTPSPSAS